MMYLHFCSSCKRIHILNGHRLICPACDTSLTELKMPYLEYIYLDESKRNEFLISCMNEEKLACLKTSYRMHKYAGRYRKKT